MKRITSYYYFCKS